VDLASPLTRPCTYPTKYQLPPGLLPPLWQPPVQPVCPLPQQPSLFLPGKMTTTFTQSACSLFPPAPSPNALKEVPLSTSRHSFDYMTASIYTEELRAMANMEFLSICLLLTHFSPNFSLYDVVHRCTIPPEHNPFPREPCKHARRKVLANLAPSKPTLLLHSGRKFIGSRHKFPSGLLRRFLQPTIISFTSQRGQLGSRSTRASFCPF
jgi:hypothetical protein